MKAVILAGGKGTRLKPYTTIFPKPLMPVWDKPILEVVIQRLQNYGFDDIIISVGHLSELIQAFFNNGNKLGVNITYKKEDKPLGTAGPLALMKKELNEPFIMMNGDILSTIDYSELINFHKKNGGLITVALMKRDVKIDFGIVKLNEKNSITKYIEKPTLDYLVSMGIYVIDPLALNYIEEKKYLDFPDLIKILIANNEEVKGYVFDGYWLDIGRLDDYEKANTTKYNKIFNENLKNDFP